MSTPVPVRYFNISGFTQGTTGYSSVKKVSYTQEWKEIVGAGDADLSATFMAQGMQKVKVTIELEDSVQAQALANAASADIVFKGMTAPATIGKSVTIKGFTPFHRQGSDQYNELAKCVVEGLAFNSGNATLVTEATASS